MNTKKLLGERIRALRKGAKLTQDQLAERIGMSKQHISNIECGKENTTYETLEKLWTALQIEPWEILMFEASPLQEVEVLRARLMRVLEEADAKQLRQLLKVIVPDKKGD